MIQLVQENKLLREKLNQQEKRLRTLESNEKRKHYKLLLDSIYYNLIACTIIYVWGKEEWKKKRKRVRSLEDIETEPKNAHEFDRWKEINDQITGDCADLLDEFSEGRTSLTHPTSINPDHDDDDDDENNCATPEELNNIVNTLYRHRDSNKKRETAAFLIEVLDKYSRKVGRKLLE